MELLDAFAPQIAHASTAQTVRIGAEALPDQYFDVAIEASGASLAVGATLAAVRRRGVMVQLGMFPPGPRPAELSALIAKEIDYRGAFRFDTEFNDAIALLAQTDALDPVITHSVDLPDAAEAMDVAAEPRGVGQGHPPVVAGLRTPRAPRSPTRGRRMSYASRRSPRWTPLSALSRARGRASPRYASADRDRAIAASP